MLQRGQGENVLQLPVHVINLHEALGIPESFAGTCKLPFCEEATNLVETEPDFYDRRQQLTPESYAAWRAMKGAAAEAGVEFFLISAFRTIQYQHDLIQRKLDLGLPITEILTVNAAPGFSEHHTGRAVDIGTYGCNALEEEFEKTSAFQWLEKNALQFGFSLSYPRNNAFGVIYEPWHWCFKEE